MTEQDPEIDEIVRRTLREINQAKIKEPGQDQYVDRCHWSKTGWAVWNKSGGCTCMPAPPPADQAAPTQGEG